MCYCQDQTEMPNLIVVFKLFHFLSINKVSDFNDVDIVWSVINSETLSVHYMNQNLIDVAILYQCKTAIFFNS